MTNRKRLAIFILFAAVLFLILLYSGLLHFSIPNIRTYTGWLPGLIAFAALIDSTNPCAFSVLFLTLAFLYSLGRSRKSIFQAGLAFVFGIFATYVLIGLGLLQALSIFNIPNLMSKIGALAIIIFGLLGFLDQIIPNFPIKLKIPSFAYTKIGTLVEKATIPAAMGLGFTVGIFEFPCTGGPYLFVLGLLHDHAEYLKGLAYLLFYNLVFVLPLFIALLIASNQKVLESMDQLRRAETKEARIWLSLLMILLGMFIFVIQ
jgi:cytochrome c biogenesis protein CcdA